MSEQNELGFHLNRVGDGPVFEVVLNNVRLDITKVAQLYSVRFSGLISQTQIDKLARMLEGNKTKAELAHGPDTSVNVRNGFNCGHPLCDVVTEHKHLSDDPPPFDGPFVRGPIIE